ncbi:T9SS type A sorting domain-containing protein [Hymenobacter sp. UYCo722]|uniref:beta strand repeat-containing protein n=1 Tax=Hymenobacter sp. UYCo722 TaxID=3156335 RepID=UPI00339AC48A
MKAFLLGLLALLWSTLAMGGTLYTFNGGGTSGNWTDQNIWTTDPTGSTLINSRVPANGDAVVITNSFVVFVNSAIATTSLDLTIQRGGVLDLQSASATFATLNSLSGQGTLRIKAPYFPAVTTNNFDKANTGTVEFYNWAAGVTALPVPASGSYNNLRLLNTGGAGTAFTAQLDNTLTINGALTLTRTDAVAFPDSKSPSNPYPNTSPTIKDGAAKAAAGAGISFTLGKTASANRTLTVQDVSVGAGTFLGITAVAGSHTVNVNGNFVNNGTVNLHNGTADDTQVAALVFKGAFAATFASNGDTDLDILKVDKGIDSQVQLDVTSTNGLRGNPQGNLHLRHVGTGVDLLVLVNGVTKIGGNVYLDRISTVTATGTGFSLGAPGSNPTLWIAGGSVYNDNANAFIIYGTYRISAGGTFHSVNFDAMVVREDGQLLIEGGTTTVDKFRPSSTSASHRGSFIITGGLFEAVGTFPNSITVAQARFSLPYLTQAFRMTGGTIRVANPSNSTGAFHIGVDPNNAIVSGGTIEIILPNDNTNASILSTAPLWNLTIKKPTAGGTSKALLAAITSEFPTPGGTINPAQPLTVLNDFTLDATNPVTFDAVSLNLTIQGTFTLNSNSTYLPGTNTTIFSGGQDQQLFNSGTIGTVANASTFNNWTVNKSAGTLQLAGSVGTYNVPAAATLSLLRGVLNDGGKIVNVKGNMVNSASHTSGGGNGNITLSGAAGQTVNGDGTGVFGNLKISNTAASGTVGVIFNTNLGVASTLTMNSDNVLAIGTNRLALTNVLSTGNGSALAAGPGISFGKTCFIQTAGNQSDLGLQKTYGKGDSFTFPVGTGIGTTVRYAPATIELRLATSAPLDRFGQVSVSPVKVSNPFVTNANNLAYYWKVRSVGFGTIPAGSVYETFTMTNADATGTLTDYVPGRYIPINWTSYTTGDMNIGGTLSFINFSAINNFAGEFTAGVPAAFNAVTAYYTRATGNWEAPATWSTAGFNGAIASGIPGASNPVFIEKGRVVTVTANGAVSGSLEIANGGTLDVQNLTGHNFGALPDSKPGGSGRLRINSATFPGGDFGSFLQAGGGTVEYYATNSNFTLPTTSASGLNLTTYRNLWVNAASARTITMPNSDLRIFAELRVGTTTTYPGTVLMSASAATSVLRADSLMAVQAGIFRFSNGTVFNLIADTDVRIDAGATFDTNTTGVRVDNSLTVGGSLTNNGTLNFKVGNSPYRRVNLTFTGNRTTNLNGTTAGASTDLYTLTVDKGTGRTATLNVDVAGTLTTPTSGWLTLTNGTLRFAKTNGTLTIHDAESPYVITDNAGLTVDGSGATATVATGTTAASDLKLAGEIRVLQGTLEVGTTTGVGSDLEYASAGAPTLKVTTGTLYVNGQIRRSVNNLDGSLRFDQSGGNINIDGRGATALQNKERGLFEVQGPKSTFRMSGGTLNLRRSNNNPTIAADFYLAPDSTVVTGGIVLLGNTLANTPATVSVSSTAPIYDLKVENGTTGSANTGLLTGVLPLTLKGSLTIGNDFSFFNANGLPLNIYQNLVNNNTSTSTALNAGGFQPITTTQTTSFLGGIATQSITGTASNQTVFGSLVMNTPQTSGKLQLNGTARTTGTLTLTKGTFDDNGFTLTALGDVANSATHTSLNAGSITLAGTANQNVGGNGTGRFGNLTLNNALGATTTANQEITKVLALSNGVLTIGSNLLHLSNPASTAVTGDATHFIRTNGIVADLGVRKAYATGATAFSFPVGTSTKYTPVQLNLTANSAAGTLTVQPVDKPHPSTTDPLNKELKYYWKVSSTGLGSPTIDKVFTYVAGDVSGTEANYKLGRFLNGAWTPAGGVVGSAVNTSLHTLTSNGTTAIDGDYTGGEPSEFGAVPAFYSRNATAGVATGAPWTSATAWTFNPDGSDSSPLPATFPTVANPVVILPNHLIYSNASGLGAATLLLNGTLDLSTFAANNFNTVTGTGILRIGSALFPAGNYSGFVMANTGTVDFTGAGQLPARDTYNNLSLSGGTAKLLSNLDLTINGTLNVAANTQVDNASSQNLTLTSATSGATINGTFNLFDGNLTTGASLTSGVTGTLNLGAGTVTTGTTLATLAGGTINQGSGLVSVGTSLTNAGTFNGNTGKVAVAQNFTNSGTYVAKVGNLEVINNLTNTGDFTANLGEVNAGGIFSNAGTYTANTNNIMHATGEFFNLAGGSFDAGTSNLVLRNNFTNRGTFTSGTSLVQFITDANRILNGSTTFSNLQKLGNSSLTLGTSTDVHVTGLMTIQNSVIFTGANTNNVLYLDNGAIQPIVGNTLTSYVVGRLAMTMPNVAGNSRVFPVGAGQRYRPVTIKNVGGSTNAVVLVEIINGAPAGNVDQTLDNLSANRYYRIQLQSGSITNPTIQLSFNTDVADEIVNVPGNLRVAKTTGPIGASTVWATAGGAGVFSPDFPRGYTISATNLTAITSNSFFALASTNRVDNPLTGSAPLPVTLITFSATRQGAAVQVAWATASEKSSAYFAVERSADGRAFSEIARVEALGSSTARHDYGTLDGLPLGGTSYYRLRQVDKDGTTAYSNVATVRFDGKVGAPALVAYPNPTTGSGFHLATSNLASTNGTVRVFDNVGRLVFSQTVAAGMVEATVQPTQPLASGMYIATWTTADGVKLTTKVSVE